MSNDNIACNVDQLGFFTATNERLVLLDGRVLECDTVVPFVISDFHGSHKFDFSWVDRQSLWGPVLLKEFIKRLSTHSLRYVCFSAYCAKRLFYDQGFNQYEPISLAQISQIPELLPVSYWPFLQPLLKRLANADQGEVIEESLRLFLAQPQKWEIKGKGQYFALLVNDPHNGSFTEQELLSIHNGVNQAYQFGQISLYRYALIWMFIGTGVRPIQIAKMVVDDVKIYDGPEGKEVILNIPLAKGEKAVVTEKWQRKCPSVVADVLLKYLSETERSKDMPLFSDQSVTIQNSLKRSFDNIETYSQRTEGPIHITPYRFRYTLGTRAIAQGASNHEVARLLTHRTTWCVQYYRASMPDLQKPIRDALTEDMSVFVDAFRGRVISGPDQATRENDPSAIIRDFMNLDGQGIGACGTTATCHQHVPTACLTCPKFEPFKEAPWETLLGQLQNEMGKEPDDRIKMILSPPLMQLAKLLE